MKIEQDKIKSRKKWFIIIGVLLVISIVSIIISANHNSILNPNSNYKMYAPIISCSQIQGTPTWVQNGIILGSGYNFPEQMAQKSYPDFVKDYLIPNKIEMFFSYSCTWCKKQIAEFGNVQWNEYLQSGLTKDCSKEFNFTETEG